MVGPVRMEQRLALLLNPNKNYLESQLGENQGWILAKCVLNEVLHPAVKERLIQPIWGTKE